MSSSNPSSPSGADLSVGQLAELSQSEADRLLSEFMAGQTEQVKHWIGFRIDSRLQRRMDLDDVVQESFLAARKRWEHYRRNPEVSLRVWLRSVVLQTLVDLHRRHLGAQQRDAGRETYWNPGQGGDATSVCLVNQLAGNLTSPSLAVARNELANQVTEALQQLNESDREVLALRHFESMTNREVAEILQISEKAASIRYVRALQRIRPLLQDPDAT